MHYFYNKPLHFTKCKTLSEIINEKFLINDFSITTNPTALFRSIDCPVHPKVL